MTPPILRAVDTFGPSPIPPAVISTRVPAEIRRRPQDALLTMHRTIHPHIDALAQHLHREEA